MDAAADSSLHDALKRRATFHEIVSLVEANPELIEVVDQQYGTLPLHSACYYNYNNKIKITEFLVARDPAALHLRTIAEIFLCTQHAIVLHPLNSLDICMSSSIQEQSMSQIGWVVFLCILHAMEVWGTTLMYRNFFGGSKFRLTQGQEQQWMAASPLRMLFLPFPSSDNYVSRAVA